MMPDAIRSKDQVMSLARGLSVLRLFGEKRETMSISEVAQAAGMTAASARRVLLTLRELGYVGQNGKRFRVMPKVLDLGYAYLSSMPIWQVAQPVIERIGVEFKVSCSGAVLDIPDIVYVVRAPHGWIRQVMVGIGTRQPAHLTAMGRVLLANLETAALEPFLASLSMKPFTPRSITSRDKLRTLLKTVRLANYAVVDQELDIGVRAIAVPIRNRMGAVVASINAMGHSRTVEIDFLTGKVLPALLEGADEIRAGLAA
jgi:IclR family pca regulon transcriptional regulator